MEDVKQIRNIINQNITYWSNSLIFITYPYMFFYTLLIIIKHITYFTTTACYFLILFEINIDNNIKGEPNENNLKQKTIISIISSKEIQPPFITNKNIIKPSENTKKQHVKISIKRIIIWRILFIIRYPHDGASVLACAYQLKVRSKIQRILNIGSADGYE